MDLRTALRLWLIENDSCGLRFFSQTVAKAAFRATTTIVAALGREPYSGWEEDVFSDMWQQILTPAGRSTFRQMVLCESPEKGICGYLNKLARTMCWEIVNREDDGIFKSFNAAVGARLRGFAEAGILIKSSEEGVSHVRSRYWVHDCPSPKNELCFSQIPRGALEGQHVRITFSQHGGDASGLPRAHFHGLDEALTALIRSRTIQHGSFTTISMTTFLARFFQVSVQRCSLQDSLSGGQHEEEGGILQDRIADEKALDPHERIILKAWSEDLLKQFFLRERWVLEGQIATLYYLLDPQQHHRDLLGIPATWDVWKNASPQRTKHIANILNLSAGKASYVRQGFEDFVLRNLEELPRESVGAGFALFFRSMVRELPIPIRA